MRVKRRFLSLSSGTIALSIAIALLIVAGIQVPTARADSPSFVRIIHSSPDIGSADVFVDGQHLLSNFQFGTVTPYVPLPAGPHVVKVSLIGRGPGAAVITQTLDVSPGVPYTVAALGTAATGFSLEVFIDNNLITPTLAKVRVYHLSPGTGEVNVTTGGNQVISGLGYKEASNYLSMVAGNYTLNVSATQNNVTLPLATDLKSGTVTSIFAIGLLDGTPKIQFVSEQVNGIPGLPGTGSDPNAAPPDGGVDAQSFTPWLLGMFAVIALAGWASRRRKVL